MVESDNTRANDAAAGAVTSFVYITNAEDGDIATYALHADGAVAVGPRVPIGGVVGPLAMSPDRRFVYAAARSEPYAVHAYAREPDTGALRPLGAVPVPASYPYISLDATGRYLFGASYGSSLITVTAVAADGRVAAEPQQLIMTAGNAHAIAADAQNRFVYVPALGSDTVFQFRFDADSGRLSPLVPPSVQVEPLSGPRHFAISADNRFFYLLCEMRAIVITFAIDPDSGVLRQIASISALTPDTPLKPGVGRGAAAPANAASRDSSRDIWAADIHLTPDGRFLYTSERTGSTLSLFTVDASSGALDYRASFPTETQPRSFAIDPTGRYLVACGEQSPTISVYAIDSATGELRLLQKYPAGRGANWVEIASA